jgi:hypothetical protein
LEIDLKEEEMIPGDLIFISATYYNEKVIIIIFRVKGKFTIWCMLRYLWDKKNHWDQDFKKERFKYLMILNLSLKITTI